MAEDAGEGEYRPGLWLIQFTASDGERAREYARRGAAGDGALQVAAAGRYGFAAVGTHQQVIALRHAVLPAGESFAITRAIMAELHPDGQQLTYEGSDPRAFCEQARTRLGLDPAEDDRWEQARQFRCPATLLDVLMAGFEEWRLRQDNGRADQV